MTTEDTASPATTFRDLGLSEPLLAALDAVGYESPSPIQAATIPPLLAGRDLVGQAQTGTGKTAAFALPILQRIDVGRAVTQALVLCPTRELAIQVAEAFQRYASKLPGFHVLPIYGGQGYGQQLSSLKRGTHVVVATPGRLIDHLERGSLKLGSIATIVLDEADEMLRMGFIDDVEKILDATPPGRQVALFSATMPAPIRRIAQKHLKDPAEIAIKSKTSTATNTRQRYWMVGGMHKLDALTRILEAEPFEAMIVFARTKQATEELAERLSARGFSAAAINGDIIQQQRERTIQRLRDGQLDILVATDVAARGLDVERISHVLNYDIPYDTESYVHRIGRTGRAGRSGEAILFVTPRERYLLKVIERATKQPLEAMDLPTVEAVNDRRVAKFMGRITDTLAAGGLDPFQQLIERYEREHDVPAVTIAAAMARIAHGEAPLLLDPPKRVERERPPAWEPQHDAVERRVRPRDAGDAAPRAPDTGERPARPPRDGERTFKPRVRDDGGDGPKRPPRARGPEPGMVTYRVAVGHAHGVKPGNLVGAIANEANLESRHIGRIEIEDTHSLVDLPEGMPAETLQHLQGVWVSGQRLRIRLDDGSAGDEPAERPARPEKKEGFRKPGSRKPGGFKPGFKKRPPR